MDEFRFTPFDQLPPEVQEALIKSYNMDRFLHKFDNVRVGSGRGKEFMVIKPEGFETIIDNLRRKVSQKQTRVDLEELIRVFREVYSGHKLNEVKSKYHRSTLSRYLRKAAEIPEWDWEYISRKITFNSLRLSGEILAFCEEHNLDLERLAWNKIIMIVPDNVLRQL